MHPEEVITHEAATGTVVEHAAEAAHAGGIHVSIAAEKIGEYMGIPITNALITSWVTVALLVIVAFVMRNRLKMIPSRFQLVLESMVEFIYDYIADTLGSRDMARKFFPLLTSIFLFIFVANMLHFIPGVGSIGFFTDHGFEALLRAPNSDLTMPLVLALVSFFVIEITGILTIGIVKYGSKFLVNPIRDPLGFGIGLIELIGELVRVVSLSFRLFGNILAGEVLITVATYFAPVVLPVPLMMFEIFIGFLQAAVFSLLTLFFIKLAIAEPHGAESHAH